MALLSRVADRIYWAARYIERAEDSARVLRSFGELLADIPNVDAANWQSLVTIAGSDTEVETNGNGEESQERIVVRFLMSDPEHANSIHQTVESCRSNLRTCREVVPREAWETVNDLTLYVRPNASRSLDRRPRDVFLARVINDSRRLDGVMTSSMTRDEAFELWRLGRYIERADMTTRVVGVRAASLLALPHGAVDQFAEVRWMSVLRSLSALQMYQRASHGPIDGPEVVRFLLFDHRFPRSVAGCLAEVRSSLLRLPANDDVLRALEHADQELHQSRPAADDGAALDAAMERVQGALANLHNALAQRYLEF
jgi:uncharacterized alpha-E superfamily protein